MKKKEGAKMPTANITIKLVMETEENKKYDDFLKPAMYLDYSDVSLDYLALMCRSEELSCPFAGLGCPFNNKEWQKMHEGERCTANPCRYIQAKDWEDAFGIFYREKVRKDEEFLEDV